LISGANDRWSNNGTVFSYKILTGNDSVTLTFKLVDNQTLEDAEETLTITLTDAVATVNGTTQDIKIGTATATTVRIKNDSFNVKWQTIAGADANKATISADPNSGGQRVFPEKSTPTGAIENKFELVFELEVAATANTTLYFKIFDADNFIGLGNNDNNADACTGNDNYASLSATTGSVTIATGATSATLTVVVYPANYTGTKLTGNTTTIVIDSAHVGDNFIVVADTNQTKVNTNATLGTTEGTRYKETNGYVQTDLLTVWRTLNVELDTTTWTGMPDGDIKAPLDGLVENELARACVAVKEFTQEDFTVLEVPAVAQDGDIDAILGISLDASGVPYVSGPGIGREIAHSTPLFWTVRILTVPKTMGGETFGAFVSPVNSIVLSYGNINSKVETWNALHPDESTFLSYELERTVLHEICHVLIDDNNEVGIVFNTSGVPRVYSTGNAVDVSTIGVRNYIGRDANNVPNIENDLYRRHLYSSLVTTDIRDIQKHSLAYN
jgi:hypothetical protein